MQNAAGVRDKLKNMLADTKKQEDTMLLNLSSFVEAQQLSTIFQDFLNQGISNFSNLILSFELAKPLRISGDFRYCNFSNSRFENIELDGDFSYCDFRHCIFNNVRFSANSLLSHSRFENVKANKLSLNGKGVKSNFNRTKIKTLQITGIYDDCLFKDSNINLIKIPEYASLQSCNFANATLDEIQIKQCSFRSTNFQKAKIIRADLCPRMEKIGGQEINLCDIQDAQFWQTYFGKNVRIEFDRNKTLGTMFEARRKDDWYKLIRAYTPLSQVINSLFPIVFFLTLFLKLYAYKVLVTVNYLADKTSHSNLLPQLDNITAWDIVFGRDMTTILVSILLLVFQVLRFHVASIVQQMTSDYSSHSITPLRKDYLQVMKKHHIVKLLGVIALSVFVYDTISIFFMKMSH
jgi:uncharacterized protein YjbI with pentapeptide repeats